MLDPCMLERDGLYPETKPDFAFAQHKCIKGNVAGQESHVVAHG